MKTIEQMARETGISNDGYWLGGSTSVERFAALVRAQALEEAAATAWVPVEDRLPPENVNVLVLFPRENGMDFSVRSLKGRSWYPGGSGVGRSSHWAPISPPNCTVRVWSNARQAIVDQKLGGAT